MKQELYESKLQLKTKNAFISELQNDVEQMHLVEDENFRLITEIETKDADLKQWSIKVMYTRCITNNIYYYFIYSIQR